LNYVVHEIFSAEMSHFITKHARWIAWALLGFYVILIGTGLALQYVSGMQASGAGTPVPPSSIPCAGVYKGLSIAVFTARSMTPLKPWRNLHPHLKRELKSSH
jgi:hypothetical protein